MGTFIGVGKKEYSRLSCSGINFSLFLDGQVDTLELVRKIAQDKDID